MITAFVTNATSVILNAPSINVRSAEQSCRNSTLSEAHGRFEDCSKIISKMSFKKIARGEILLAL